MPNREQRGGAGGKQQAGLSQAEQRRLMAECGDVEGIWKVLNDTPHSLLDVDKMFRLLLRAVEVAARDDPAGFAASTLARLISFTTYLTLRGQLWASRQAAGDQSMLGPGQPWFSRELATVVIPQLQEMQAQLADLLQAQASTARLWELARQKQRENERAAALPAPRRSRALVVKAGDVAGRLESRPVKQPAREEG
jgi:hypothetical protein